MEIRQKQKFKAQAHSLKNIVLIGNKGLTENVILEINLALVSHNLIKVKLGKITKEEKQNITTDIIKKTKSELVQIIGNILVLYRKNSSNKQ